MFLKTTYLFLFICIHTWVSAASCEDGFSQESALISFVKKQKGEAFEKELEPKWSDKITQKTKDWTQTETSQFLNFLISRFGEENTVKIIEAFSEFEGATTPKKIITRVAFYDQININIVNHILLFHVDFNLLMTNSNPNYIQKINTLIESYIGKTGAAYIMWHLLIYRDMLVEAHPDEMIIVMGIVEYYTNKYGVTTDTLENRVHFFKTWVSSTDRKTTDIQFRNFREFIEFNKIAAETLREKSQRE